MIVLQKQKSENLLNAGAVPPYPFMTYNNPNQPHPIANKSHVYTWLQPSVNDIALSQ